MPERHEGQYVLDGFGGCWRQSDLNSQQNANRQRPPFTATWMVIYLPEFDEQDEYDSAHWAIWKSVNWDIDETEKIPHHWEIL